LSKGLLEKRLEDESYEYYIPETPDKVRVVRIEEISKIVEEMRKEVPQEKINDNGEVQIGNWFIEVKQWKKKWFGDSE